jgi:hypothetical protein
MAEGSAKLAFAIGTKGTGKCVRRAEANVRQVRQGNIEIQIDRDVDRDPEEHLICDALQIALVATQLETAWHSGAVTAESAMRVIGQIISDLMARYERRRENNGQ